MPHRRDILAWFESVRGKPGVKLLTGLRGTGKRELLLKFREHLLAEGVPSDCVIFLDIFATDLRHLITSDLVLAYVKAHLPVEGMFYLLIPEVTMLPAPEFVVATLFEMKHVEIFATSSTRTMLDKGWTDAFARHVVHTELLPPEDLPSYDSETARRRIYEIFLFDVLSTNRIGEVSLAARLACYLSDRLGDPMSLRALSAAISPSRRFLSPHTIEAYLKALCDAHLVEKVLRWDLAEEAPQKTDYRYYFTDPQLRLAHYGPSSENEARRMALNRAWLHLRHRAHEVYAASGAPHVDFVTRTGSVRTCWHVEPDGSVREVDPFAPAEADKEGSN